LRLVASGDMAQLNKVSPKYVRGHWLLLCYRLLAEPPLYTHTHISRLSAQVANGSEHVRLFFLPAVHRFLPKLRPVLTVGHAVHLGGKKKTRSGLLGTELTGRPIQVAVMSAEQRVCASDTLIGWRINGPNVMTERTQVSWICLRPSAH